MMNNNSFNNRTSHSKLASILAGLAFVLLIGLFRNKSSQEINRILLEHEEIHYFRSNKIPNIVHFMLLGSDVPPYMTETVLFSKEHLEGLHTNVEVKIWHDDDCDELVASQKDEKLTVAWQAVKAEWRDTRNAKMADFMRILVLYVYGGIFLDADMVPCNGLDYLMDTPGVVSFPFVMRNHFEVSNAAISAPKGHLLFKMILEDFMEKGKSLTNLGILTATGPTFMAKMVDNYIEKMGLNAEAEALGFELPRFQVAESDKFSLPKIEGAVQRYGNNRWLQIGDLRYRNDFPGESKVYHLGFGSWFYNAYHKEGDHSEPCREDVSLIKPWLNWMCSPEGHVSGFNQCGIINV